MRITLLTGLPHSGTTLLCALLNQMPNAIAMAEPLQVGEDWTGENIVLRLDQFLAGARVMALNEGVFLTRTRNGLVVDNFLNEPNGSAALRKPQEVLSYVSVGKKLSADFHLFIKHPALFTLFSGQLSNHYSIYASVRNPLAVLASWQTVDMPIYHGRQGMVERFDQSLAKAFAAIPDRIERQIEMLTWMFSKYERLGSDRVLRYEDVIADPVGQLSRLHDQVVPTTHRMNIAPLRERYPNVDLQCLAKRLRRLTSRWVQFYPGIEAELDRYAN